MTYLQPANQKAVGDFLNSAAWRDVKDCLRNRRPPAADVKDPSHVAAARGHKYAAWDEVITAIEKLPFEFAEAPKSPFERPAVSITAD